MSKVDDELTRRLHRAERPVDGDGLFEGLKGRRSRRERLHRIQAGALGFAVLAATVAGFSVLTDLFDPAERGVVAGTPYGSVGAIVACSDGRGGQLCRIDADALARGITSQDLVRITDFSSGQVVSPAVSPDGSRVVFEHHEPGGETNRAQTAELWTIRVDGTGLRQLTEPGSGYVDPSWSSAGLLVAVASEDVSQDTRSAALVILDPSSDTAVEVSRIDLPGLTFPSSPQWIPGGERILFGANAGSRMDLFTVAPDGSQLRDITNDSGFDYVAPRVSPDGQSIAYWVGSPNGVEIRICSLECSDSRTLSDPEGGPIYGDFPVWSPDGNWIAFQVTTGPGTDLHIARTDGSDERVLGRGIGEIAWIPVSIRGTTPTPEPEPSPTSSPLSEGRDIGLGFPICNAERLEGIDWYGDGTLGAAWTGARVTESGTCPASGADEYIVAADLDGDGSAEPGGIGFLEHCLLCHPVAATDLSGDGVLELVVLDEASSTPSYSLYEVSLPTSERSPGIYSLFVAPPGYRAGGFPGGEPIRFSAGGDEGYSAAVDCKGYPEAPILVVAWSNYEVDVDDTEDVYVTRLRLGADGAFHVIAGEHATQGVDDSLPIDPAGTACGVAFDPFA